MEELITLKSSDGTKFQLARVEAMTSKLIQHAIEDDDCDSDEDNVCEENSEAIPVNVNADILEMVVEFMKHHAIDPLRPISQPLGPNFRSQIAQDYYFNFIEEKSVEDIFKLSSAANYLDISPLFDLTVLYCSFQLMDKSAEEIREFLKLPKMSVEEEKRAREEHSWMF